MRKYKMSWKLLTLKLIVLAVGLYYARQAFLLQKQIINLKLNMLVRTTPENTQLLAVRESEFRTASIIAGVCLVPLILYSIAKSMIWIAVIAAIGVVAVKYMN